MYCGRQACGDFPWEQLLDAVDWMIGDAGQHVAEIGFGIKAIEFGTADQAVNRGGAFAAGIGAGEQLVFAAECDRAQGAFRVVVDLDATVIHVT